MALTYALVVPAGTLPYWIELSIGVLCLCCQSHLGAGVALSLLLGGLYWCARCCPD